jgi:hypothetical protein
MNPSEIIGAVSEGAKWLALGGTSLYAGIMLSDPFSMLFSKRIGNQKELDEVIEKESGKLGLSGICGIYLDKPAGRAAKFGRSNFIEMGGVGANRIGVRHELYHHYKGHTDLRNRPKNKSLDKLEYWMKREPQACLYGATGIKL